MWIFCRDGADLQVLDYAVLVISGADGGAGDMWRHSGGCFPLSDPPPFCLSTRWIRKGQMRQNFFAAAKTAERALYQVCSMPQPPDNADIASGIRTLGTGTDAVSAMRTNASDSPLPCAAPIPCPGFLGKCRHVSGRPLERYLDGDTLTWEDAALLVKERKLFPCFFWIGTKSLWRGCAIVRAVEADERAGIHRGVWGTCF